MTYTNKTLNIFFPSSVIHGEYQTTHQKWNIVNRLSTSLQSRKQAAQFYFVNAFWNAAILSLKTLSSPACSFFKVLYFRYSVLGAQLKSIRVLDCCWTVFTERKRGRKMGGIVDQGSTEWDRTEEHVGRIGNESRAQFAVRVYVLSDGQFRLMP